jgi:hypothetical protein
MRRRRCKRPTHNSHVDRNSLTSVFHILSNSPNAQCLTHAWPVLSMVNWSCSCVSCAIDCAGCPRHPANLLRDSPGIAIQPSTRPWTGLAAGATGFDDRQMQVQMPGFKKPCMGKAARADCLRMHHSNPPACVFWIAITLCSQTKRSSVPQLPSEDEK